MRATGTVLLIAASALFVLNRITASEPIWVYLLGIALVIAGVGFRIEAAITREDSNDIARQ
jgi:uncharacterized membrane protein HdeD (DUF308 family)